MTHFWKLLSDIETIQVWLQLKKFIILNLIFHLKMFKRNTAWKVSKYGVFSDLYVPAFGLNTERYWILSLFSSSVGKYGSEKTPYLDTFHAVEKILKELNNLNINKATENTDIPNKTIKKNSDIFWDFIFSNLNCCINTSSYPSLLKRADITPVHKKDSKVQKTITDQLVYCLTSPSCLKASCLNKCQNILKVLFPLNMNVNLGKVLVPSTV